MDFNTLTTIAFISGITQAVKLQFPTYSSLAPILAVLIGGVLGYYGFNGTMSWQEGMFLGGSAAGLYALASGIAKK